MRAAALLAALVVALAVPETASATPQARAAGCTTNTGVTVVVDYHQLGGGVSQTCDGAGADKAGSSVFPEAGYPLTYVQSQPGFVCRVSGQPAQASCADTPPTNAYWGLFWSDGTNGWVYSSVGVGGLKVPAGGSIAFSWQGSDSRALPGVDPRQRTADAPSAKPSSRPTTNPTKKPKPTPSAVASATPAPTAVASTTAPATPSPSATVATPSPTASASAVATPTVEPSTTPSEEATASAARATSQSPAAEETSGGLPWWLPTGVLVVLLGGIGTALWRRRAA